MTIIAKIFVLLFEKSYFQVEFDHAPVETKPTVSLIAQTAGRYTPAGYDPVGNLGPGLNLSFSKMYVLGSEREKKISI